MLSYYDSTSEQLQKSLYGLQSQKHQCDMEQGAREEFPNLPYPSDNLLSKQTFQATFCRLFHSPVFVPVCEVDPGPHFWPTTNRFTYSILKYMARNISMAQSAKLDGGMELETKPSFQSIVIVTLKLFEPVFKWAPLIAQLVRNLPTVQETGVRSLGWEDPLEKEMANHSREILWTEEPRELQSIESQRVRHNWETKTSGRGKKHFKIFKINYMAPITSAKWKRKKDSPFCWSITQLPSLWLSDSGLRIRKSKWVTLCKHPCESLSSNHGGKGRGNWENSASASVFTGFQIL